MPTRRFRLALCGICCASTVQRADEPTRCAAEVRLDLGQFLATIAAPHLDLAHTADPRALLGRLLGQVD